MLTNGPSARIGEILEIDLPRPRNRITLADDPRYNRYRQEVLRFLYENSAKWSTWPNGVKKQRGLPRLKKRALELSLRLSEPPLGRLLGFLGSNAA